MKVGSIVECVKDCYNWYLGPCNTPVIGQIYTVRKIELSPDGRPHLLLEEIINEVRNYPEGPGEKSWWVLYFREIEFPPAIEAEITECLQRELIEKI